MIGRSTAELEARDKLLGAILALIGTAGALMTAAGGPAVATVSIAMLGFGGASLGVLLRVQQARTREIDERRTGWHLPPLRMAEMVDDATLYEIGVDHEAPDSLKLLGVLADGHPEYVPRGMDGQLRERLQEASTETRASLVVVSGPSKAGKSRTALKVAAKTLRDAWLLSPKSADAVAKLAKPWPPRGLGDGPCIIWIDDIEVCAHGQRGLNLDAMRAFGKWKRPVIVLATQGGKGLALSENSGFREIVGDLLARYPPLQLNPMLDEDELRRVREMYPPAVEQRVAREGLGEFMIAAPRLIDRLRNGDSAAGRAIAMAAIDCRRTGLLRPLSVSQLNELYVHYLVGAPTSEAFSRGLEWAAEPLYSTVALILRFEGDPDAYAPHDYVVAWANREGLPIHQVAWDRALNEYAQDEDDLLRIAAVANGRGDTARAESAWRRADSVGSGLAARALGGLFEKRGEPEKAEAAYRRAEGRGDVHSSGALGLLLRKRGDLTAAAAALQRSDEGGDAQGACWHGTFLNQEASDLDAAEAAFRRAIARGHWHASAQLGYLLEHGRHDSEAADAAYRAADEHGDGVGARRIGLRLMQRGETEDAEAAFRRADRRGDGHGSMRLGMLLETRGKLKEAEAAYRRADERGDLSGACHLGLLLVGRGEFDKAETTFRRAHDGGLLLGTTRLGVLLWNRGELDEAEAVFRAALDRGPEVSRNLGLLLKAKGEIEEAESALRDAGKGDDAVGQLHLVELLEEREAWKMVEPAVKLAEELAIEGCEAGSSEAAFVLGRLRERQEDFGGAEAAYGRADELGLLEGTVRLGWLLAFVRKKTASGLAVYRRADARGSAEAAKAVGILLRARGDHLKALNAFERADMRGSADGAYRLGEMLLEGAPGPQLRQQAIAAFTRARDRASDHGYEELAERAVAAIKRLCSV